MHIMARANETKLKRGFDRADHVTLTYLPSPGPRAGLPGTEHGHRCRNTNPGDIWVTTRKVHKDSAKLL